MDLAWQQKLAEVFEGGYRSHAYKDSRGITTIGCGRNVDMAKAGPGLRLAEMKFMLHNDLTESESECLHYFRVFPDLSDVRKAVLIDMCFNMGVGKLLTFKRMLRSLAEHDYDRAADEMKDSIWAFEVGRRAKILEAMMRSGNWPEKL